VYLDSNTGSMIAQAVVAGAAGAVVVAKVGWTRLSSPLRRKGKAAEKAPAADTTEQQQ
jgi:hypothetical protein